MTPTLIRPVTAHDREAVLALLGSADGECAEMRVLWDSWQAEDAGETFVAEVEGQVAGAGNLSLLPSRQGWLALPPTHPSFRQLGIRLALAAFLSSRARQQELRVLRTGVGASETRFHRSLGQLGFHRVSVSSLFVSDGLCEGAPRLERFDDRQYSDVQNLLGRSSLLRTCAGLICLDGRWLELSGKHCREMLARGSVCGLVTDTGRVDVFAVEGRPRPAGDACPTCEFSMVDGNWQSLGRLAMAIRGLTSGPDTARVRLPDEPTVRNCFTAAGFRPEPDGRETWIFELSLP